MCKKVNQNNKRIQMKDKTKHISYNAQKKCKKLNDYIEKEDEENEKTKDE